jgi:hypothetical protein
MFHVLDGVKLFTADDTKIHHVIPDTKDDLRYHRL